MTKIRAPTPEQYNRWLKAALPKNTIDERIRLTPPKEGGIDMSWQFSVNACYNMRYGTDGYRAHIMYNSFAQDGDGQHAYDFDKLKAIEPVFVVYATAFHLRAICRAALALVGDGENPNHPVTICFGPDAVTAQTTGIDGEFHANIKDGDEWMRFRTVRGTPRPDPVKFVYEPEIKEEWKFTISAKYLRDALTIFDEGDKIEVCAGKYGKPIEIRPKYQPNLSTWTEALIVPLKA